MARKFLERLRAPVQLCDQVEALVAHHLAPALFVAQGTTARGYRRLARSLDKAGVDIALLVRVARADHWGRTTEEANKRMFPAADAFLAEAGKAAVMDAAPRDIVQGRHLQARGLEPGPRFGDILARCRDLQDETGWTDADKILDKVLGDDGPRVAPPFAYYLRPGKAPPQHGARHGRTELRGLKLVGRMPIFRQWTR